MTEGRFYFRVIEGADGRWICRRGRSDIDHHDSQQAAVDHMTTLAALHRPSEVVMHYMAGDVDSVAKLT